MRVGCVWCCVVRVVCGWWWGWGEAGGEAHDSTVSFTASSSCSSSDASSPVSTCVSTALARQKPQGHSLRGIASGAKPQGKGHMDKAPGKASMDKASRGKASGATQDCSLSRARWRQQGAIFSGWCTGAKGSARVRAGRD